MSARHLITGQSGEEAALRFLRGQGYKILAANWRHAQLEIDIICEHKGHIIFVEVKTRDAQGRSSPEQALSREKQARLIRAAAYYLQATDKWTSPCRFDFIGVKKHTHGFEVQHVPNSFDCSALRTKPGGRSYWQPW